MDHDMRLHERMFPSHLAGRLRPTLWQNVLGPHILVRPLALNTCLIGGIERDSKQGEGAYY
jgi:hypothetical protein